MLLSDGVGTDDTDAAADVIIVAIAESAATAVVQDADYCRMAGRALRVYSWPEPALRCCLL